MKLGTIWRQVRNLGFSYLLKDKRDPEETAYTLERARGLRHDLPMSGKAELYEDLLFDRHFAWDFLATEVKWDSATNPQTYRYKGFADVGCYGGRLLAAMAFKYAYHFSMSSCNLTIAAQLGKTFNLINILCRITGKKGLVARGFHKKGAYDSEGRKDWHDGQGEFADYRFYSDASPPQYSGICFGLQWLYILGPDVYKPRIRELFREIAIFLIGNDFKIKDLDGEPTDVSDFDPDCYDIGEYRPSRNLTLLRILRAAAIITGDKFIRNEYLELCDRGYAKRVEKAGFNVFGIMNAGDECMKFDDFFCLLYPGWRGLLGDGDYIKHYYKGIEQIWDWLKSHRHLPATAIYHYLMGNEERRLQEAWELLDTFPYPKVRWEIVNSNRPDVKLNFVAEVGKEPQPLLHPESIQPFYLQKQTAYTWCRDLRRADSDGDGRREFSYIDWLYGYWLRQFVMSQ